MLFLGHAGIGTRLLKPISRALPLGWTIFGTLLPDLIDKPLYYGLSFVTGLRGEALGLISGTRTLGHTAILLVCVTLFAVVRRSPKVAGIALGMATHLFLDGFGDYWDASETRPARQALLFPLLGAHFAHYPFQDLGDHLQTSLTSQYNLWGEALGGTFLAWELWLRDRMKVKLNAPLTAVRERIRRRRRGKRT